METRTIFIPGNGRRALGSYAHVLVSEERGRKGTEGGTHGEVPKKKKTRKN